MTPRQIFSVILSVVVLIGLLVSCTWIFENCDAGQVMVIQSPISGDLVWYTTPGVKWQGFGKVTTYPRRSQFWFKSNEKKKDVDGSLRIRFNDGGHAQISGAISWDMPLDDEHLTLLHQKYGSHAAIEQQLIQTVVEKSVYMTGPLMSSTESYASRRSELLNLLEDQINHGIYQTKTFTENQKDPLTGIERKITVVQILRDKDGLPKRIDEGSPLQDFKIRAFNLALNEISYEGKVEQQIQQQQEATMKVQIQILEAKAAEQQALTNIKLGEADAAKAEWMQKTIAAKMEAEAKMKKNVAETEAAMKKEVAETEAKQKLEVARLDAEAAKQFKLAEIERGEGEAKRRQLVMEADGALEKKLAAWLDAQKAYANAIGTYQGNLVPQVIMGGKEGTAQANNSVQALLDLFTVRTAKDLSLDLSMAPKKR